MYKGEVYSRGASARNLFVRHFYLLFTSIIIIIFMNGVCRLGIRELWINEDLDALIFLEFAEYFSQYNIYIYFYVFYIKSFLRNSFIISACVFV